MKMLKAAFHLAAVMVRANARVNAGSVVESETYQQFFNALGRAMFLEAQGVE